MPKMYLLFYSTDNGDREDWNTFYTPVEIYTTAEKRAARKKELEKAVDADGEPRGFQFHEIEVDVDTPQDLDE